MKMKKEPTMTWGQLKEFVNSLPDKELSKKVIWVGEERGGRINFAEQFEEDQFSTEEGFAPKSALNKEEWKEQKECGNGKLVHKKGTPMLFTDC